MFTLAFFALLRVGEFTVKKQLSSNEHVMQISHVEYKATDAIYVTLLHFKHKRSTHALTLKVSSQSNIICPMKAIKDFILLRKQIEGPLFIFPDGEPITTSFFNEKPKICVKGVVLSPSLYTGHSFRIVGATAACTITLWLFCNTPPPPIFSYIILY